MLLRSDADPELARLNDRLAEVRHELQLACAQAARNSLESALANRGHVANDQGAWWRLPITINNPEGK